MGDRGLFMAETSAGPSFSTSTLLFAASLPHFVCSGFLIILRMASFASCISHAYAEIIHSSGTRLLTLLLCTQEARTALPAESLFCHFDACEGSPRGPDRSILYKPATVHTEIMISLHDDGPVKQSQTQK